MSIISGSSSTVTTYKITCDQIKQLIAADLGVDPGRLTVNYKLKAEAEDRPCANVTYFVESVEVVFK